jgi:hypothetical protein
MTQTQSSPASARISAKIRGAVFLALSIFVLGWVVTTVIHLPGVPYNVTEMFGGDPSWATLVRFALSLLSIGMGAHFAAYFASLCPTRALTLPLWCILAVLLTLGIAQRAITSETFDDFTGSPDLYREIVAEHSWGESAARIVAQTNAGLFQHVERMVRFTALIAPLLLWLAIFDATFSRVRLSSRLRTLGAHVLLAAPWLALFKYVAFDVPSTDNLVELIEPGGGVFLYALLILIALAAASLASMSKFGSVGKSVTILFFVLAIPIGWEFLKLGLVSRLDKYGVTFSGVDFLLGPDRQHKLSGAVLFSRWAGLQIVATLGLAWSMVIAAQFLPSLGRKAAKPRRRRSGTDQFANRT